MIEIGTDGFVTTALNKTGDSATNNANELNQLLERMELDDQVDLQIQLNLFK